MARISGVDIPRDKQVGISLTYIYGIGRTVAIDICNATGIDSTTRVRDLTDDECRAAARKANADGSVRGSPRATAISRQARHPRAWPVFVQGGGRKRRPCAIVRFGNRMDPRELSPKPQPFGT